MGWISVFREIASGKGALGFLVFWLVGWTVGGAFVIASLWRLLQRSIPERLIFAKPELVYDTGIQPMAVSFDYRTQMDWWKRVFERRKVIRFAAEEIATIKLRDLEAGNRLTVDHGAERIDIAKTLTEVEREWLFQLIKKEYNV